eukprot:5529290-Prymnesium_polylepis.1
MLDCIRHRLRKRHEPAAVQPSEEAGAVRYMTLTLHVFAHALKKVAVCSSLHRLGQPPAQRLGGHVVNLLGCGVSGSCRGRCGARSAAAALATLPRPTALLLRSSRTSGLLLLFDRLVNVLLRRQQLTRIRSREITGGNRCRSRQEASLATVDHAGGLLQHQCYPGDTAADRDWRKMARGLVLACGARVVLSDEKPASLLVAAVLLKQQLDRAFV